MQPIQPIFSSSSTFVNANETITSASATSSAFSFPYVMHIGNVEEQLFTFCDSYSTETQINPVYGERQTQEYRFKIVREPVDDEIWNAFKQHNDRSTFIRLYNEFLFSSWEPSEQHKSNLKITQGSISRSQSDRHEDSIHLYDTLVEVFFYTDLRSKASHLIKSAIDLYKNNLILNNPQSFGKYKAKEAQARIIEEINNHHDHVYNDTYIKYISYRNISDQDKVLSNIAKLKHEIQNLRSNTTKSRREILILEQPHLSLINYILDTLQNNQEVTYQAIMSLLTKQIPDQEITQPLRKRKRKDKNADPCIQLSPSTSPKKICQMSSSTSLHHDIEPYSISAFLPWEAHQQGTKVDGIDVDTNDPIYKAILQDLQSCELSTSSAQSQIQNEEVSPSSFFQSVQTQEPSLIRHTEMATSNSKKSLPRLTLLHNLYTFDIYQTQLLYAISPLSEEAMLTSLLKKISGKESYFYDSAKVFNEDDNICPAKYYHSSLMLSALNAEILLLKMKNMIDELINFEQTKDPIGISNVRRRITRCLTFLSKNHKIHQKLEFILQSEKKNELPQGMYTENMGSNFLSIRDGIKNAQHLLIRAKSDYNVIVKNDNEKSVLERLQALINEKLTLVSIRRNFSLSKTQVKQLIQAFFNAQSDLMLTEEQLSALKFKMAREPVKESLWESLRVEMDKPSFRKHYFDFIRTSWENPAYIIDQVDMKINIAKKTGDYLNWCKILMERCFQEKMRSQAFHLIHYILNLIKFTTLLKGMPKGSAAATNIDRTITMNINKIMNNSNLTFDMYLKYLKERENPQINKIPNLHSEIDATPRYIYNNMSSDTKKTSKHIILINKILEEIEKNEFFNVNVIIGLINESIKETESQNEAPCVSESDVSSQTQLQFASSTPEELMARSRINFTPQDQTSQQVENIAEELQTLTDEQEKDQLLGFIFEPPERTDFIMQIEEHLDMDEQHLFDFFND